MLETGDGLDHLRVPFEKIKFKKILDVIGYGNVFEGELDGQRVALKRLNITYLANIKPHLLAEIQTISRFRQHPNLVALLGFCDDKSNEIILVYEYVASGNLADKMRNRLTTIQRFEICLGAARGLDYLHTGVDPTTPGIVHGNIKLSKILLNSDENPSKFIAKVSSFGLSNIVPHKAQKTLESSAEVPDKESDVYSFGVLLLEVLCGVSELVDTDDYQEHHVTELVPKKMEQNELQKIVHFDIRKEINMDALETYAKIACQCVMENRERRPTMAQVVEELEKALRLQSKTFRLEDILSATNNFSDENLVKEGGLGKIYKGRLSLSGRLVDIVARRLNPIYGQRDVEFRTEISMLSTFNHKNIISIVGFVDEKDEKIVIYEQAFHGSLDQHISDQTLNWSRRLQICLGVAAALNHIHYDVIHCDINSSKIFLDKDWEPKIFGFEISTKYPLSWRHRLLYSRYFHTPSMTPKFDIYCFGVLMFEVLCGRKTMITEDVLKEKMENTIDPNLSKQMDKQSLTCFLKIAKTCLKKELMERPTIDQIIKELEEALELQRKHENLEHSAAADEDATTKRLKMDFLKIPLREIKRATNNFDKACAVGAGGYGTVYKAKLDVIDIQDMSSMEGRFKDELPKISKTVAIKRIIDRQDDQGKEGFFAEIELLTSCRHPNIVSLLGYCEEKQEMIIVYEYAFKGSLSDYLESTPSNLTWAQRIQISLDIANGISYLHADMKGKPRILHRDIKSQNILLDENLNAKVADFGLSKFHSKEQQTSTMYTQRIAGTEVYLDPEYLASGKYKKESDVYAFGVVLFEILSGRLAYEKIYMMENDSGLGPIARRRFNEGTLKELIDPKVVEDDEHVFTINRGPNQHSFDAFSRIAYQCLAETQAKRPTIEDVIKELENALLLQGKTMVLSRFRLGDILSATENFSETYSIGFDAYGIVYKAKLEHFDNESLLETQGKDDSKLPKACITVAVKRISSRESGQREQRFFSEIEMHTSNSHPNIAPLLGFCDERDEMILLFEHAYNTSLADYLESVDKINKLTWTERLHMCLNIAHGINHIHTKMDSQQHGDIRSANILLGKNWEVKIAYFGVSNLHPANQEVGLKAYWDPEYEKTGKLKKESDIYSFGVVMFEIFCGRLAYDLFFIKEDERGLAPIARRCFNDGIVKRLIDPKLIEENEEESLDTILRVASKCLEETQAGRPTMEIVIKELERALH